MEISLLYFFCIFPLALASFPDRFELSSSLILLLTNPTSTDGNCGPNSDTNATCLTSTFGNCCSSKGFCGKTSAYCSEGCQDAFGTCSSASSGQDISISGSCGVTSTSNITCQGSTFGDCCSASGYCGKNSTYCGDGCQSELGTCSPVDESSTTTAATYKTSSSTAASSTSISAISVDGNCGSNSDTSAVCKGSTFGDCCSAMGYCGRNSSYCGTGCQSEFGSCDSMPSSTGSLSNGAIAGIALGSVIGLGGAIGFVTWLIKRRHDRKPSLAKMDADANSKSHGAGICNEETRYEMHGVSLVELSSIETMLNEMDASSERKQYIKRVDDRAAAGYDGAYRGN